jgi:hypothetical protein
MASNKNPTDVMNFTGPFAFEKYLHSTINDCRIGDTCTFLAITKPGLLSIQCSKSYNNYACTLWKDGSNWSSVIDVVTKLFKPTVNDIYNKATNPLNGKTLLLPSNHPPINTFIQKDVKITSEPYECIFNANNDGSSEILFQSSNEKHKNFVENVALINGISNIVIVLKPDIAKSN